MNSFCYNYYELPTENTDEVKTLELETSDCSLCGCHCGYIQYESLASYMPRLSNNYTKHEEHILNEAKLRQQIVEISRLFDRSTKVDDGYYSKAHYQVIKAQGNDTKYLEVPDHVQGSLELYSNEGYLINPTAYFYKDSYLILNSADYHSDSCDCQASCGSYKKRTESAVWKGTFQIKAKFGKECSDYAVQMAVRDFLIEHNTFADEKEAKFAGLVPRPFRVPFSWSTLVEKYNQGKTVNNYFGFA